MKSVPKKLKGLKAAAELRYIIREHIQNQDQTNRCIACGIGHLTE